MVKDEEPDYSTYSYKELEGCLERIDKEKYPERTSIIMDLLNDSEKEDELKQRDKIKDNYKSKEHKYAHIGFEAILLALSLIVLFYFTKS